MATYETSSVRSPSLCCLLSWLAMLALPACGHGSVGSTKDRLEARMADYQCVDTLPDGAAAEDSRDRVVQVVFDGDSFLGLTASNRVAMLDPDTQTTRVLWRGRFGAIAEDGSVGLAYAPSPTKGIVLEVWDLRSDQMLGAKSFEDGLARHSEPQTLAVSRGAVVVRQGEGDCEEGGCSALASLPPSSTVVQWDLATDKVSSGLITQGCGAKSMFSNDGRHFLCISKDGDYVGWNDFSSKAWSSLLAPAPDWQPPPGPHHEPEMSSPPYAPVSPLSMVEISSARLSKDGKTVYLAYHRSCYPDERDGRAPRRGWRLERWVPTAGRDSANVQVLAAAPVQLCAELLAVSPDGRLFLFGGARHRLSLRRAPDYSDTPIDVGAAASSAAFSSDGAWFVTGHTDGHMELWDAKTLKSLLTVRPKWRGDE